MIDLRLLNPCDHKMVEFIDIEGISPNYYAYISHEANPNLSTIHIFDANKATPQELFSMRGVGLSNFYLDNTNKKIIFGRYPVDNNMDFPNPNVGHIPKDRFMCSYIAKTNDCPKCGGTKYVNDIFIDAIGRMPTVTGNNKIRQQILKALTTIQGNNIFDDTYGTIANNIVGTKMDAYAAAQLQFSILECINNLIDNQYSNNVPPNEQISSISNIDAEVDSKDPRRIIVSILVMTQNFEEVDTKLLMEIR